jgi:hypothetical protein
MRKLTATTISQHYETKAKSLKKGDRVWVGRRSFRVKSNEKNDNSKRVITLKWGSNKKKDEVVLIVPGKMLFSVNNMERFPNR